MSQLAPLSPDRHATPGDPASCWSSAEALLMCGVFAKVAEVKKHTGLRPMAFAVHTDTLAKTKSVAWLRCIHCAEIEPGTAYVML
jgi:hypothetical protein